MVSLSGGFVGAFTSVRNVIHFLAISSGAFMDVEVHELVYGFFKNVSMESFCGRYHFPSVVF